MVKREHDYNHVENTIAIRRMVSLLVTYLEQLHLFRDSFSTIVSTSFAGSWGRERMVTVLKFRVFISILVILPISSEEVQHKTSYVKCVWMQ